MKVKIDDLIEIYDEIKRQVRNKKKVYDFEKRKMEYLICAKYLIESGNYNGGKYNIFLITEPKTRVIMSQNMIDKIINHYVAKKILIPKLEHLLCDENVATRKDMGLSKAIELLKKKIESFKKYGEFYFWKMDISKYFYTIDHEVLKSLVKPYLDIEEFALVSKIIDSTNESYVNEKIDDIIKKTNKMLPRYEYGKGLPIGNMTSQFLAIFYLHKVHHYMKYDLGLKFVIYMDDYAVINQDKKYLKMCKKIVEKNLNNVYKLNINEDKSYITKSTIGIPFLGYHIKVKGKRTITVLLNNSKRNVRKGIKVAKYNYKNGLISENKLFCSIMNYKGGYKYSKNHETKKIVEKYWVI